MKIIFLALLLVTTLSLTIAIPSDATTPSGSFVSAVTSGTAPLTVQFIDSSANLPTAWAWSFGDGGTSTEQNPAHSYTMAGTYTVTLTATNADGSDTISKTGYITVSEVAVLPAAAFIAAVTSGTNPLTVQFIDASTNTPTSWAWSFGDGGTSSVQNPSHTYSAAGTYTVTLTAINTGGSNTVSKSGYITVTDTTIVPVASFVSAVTAGTAPLTVQFADSTSNSPTTWAWSFGDGETSTVQNPSHIYTTAGTYTVTLTATNAAGSNTVSETAYIAVTDAEPVASFTSNMTYGTAPFAVQFNDTSANSPTSWTWVFGDGGSSTEQNPVYEYTDSGNYTVTLTVGNSAGSNMTYTTGYINVDAATAPVASFTADFKKGTPPLAVQFTDTSSYSPTSWYWSFGDGTTSTLQNPAHTYSSVGSYTVSLTAYNSGGSRTTSASDYITVSSGEVTQGITTVPTLVITTAVPITTRTTVPVTISPDSTLISSSTASAPADSGSIDLLIPAAVGTAILVLVIFGIMRWRRSRAPYWDL
jgi:PKD repeat protein